MTLKLRTGPLILALVVGWSLWGAGCANRTDPVAESSSENQPRIGSEVTVPIATAVAAVETLGQAPRTVLAAQYPAGTSQEVTLHTDHQIQQQINAQPVRDYSNPALTIPLTARAVAAGGAINLELGAISTPDPALSSALNSADGFHAGLDITELGAITALRLAPSATTSHAVRMALERAFHQAISQSITFPAEPVGVGAVWTVRQEVGGAVPLEQLSTVRLLERTGDRFTLAIAVKQTPKSTTWHLPNQVGQLEIVDYAMRGAGTLTVDLGLPLPVAGQIDIGGHQEYRDPRTQVVLRQTMNSQVSWSE